MSWSYSIAARNRVNTRTWLHQLIEDAKAGKTVSAIAYAAQLTGPRPPRSETPTADLLHALAGGPLTIDEVCAALPEKIKDAITARAVNVEKARADKENRVLVKFIEAVIQATHTNEDVTAKYQHIEGLIRKFNCNGDVFTKTRRMEASSFMGKSKQSTSTVPAVSGASPTKN